MGLSENRVYSQWNSQLIGIMISKTIGFRGTQHFQTHPYGVDPSPWQHFQWSTARSWWFRYCHWFATGNGCFGMLHFWQNLRHFFNTLRLPSENCVVQRNTADVEEKCCPIPKLIESIAILNGIQHHAIKHAAYFAGILLDWCALKEISLHDLHENCFAARRLHFLQGNLLICICATTISRFKKMRHLCNYTPDVLQKCRTCKWSCCFKRRLHFFANTVLGNVSKRNDCCVFWGHTDTAPLCKQKTLHFLAYFSAKKHYICLHYCLWISLNFCWHHFHSGQNPAFSCDFY